MTPKEQRALARKAFDVLDAWAPSNALLWRAVSEARTSERRHRRPIFGGSFRAAHPGCASIEDCARMFVVRWIAHSILTRPQWRIEDIGSIRSDVTLAGSIAARDGDIIAEIWAREGIRLTDVDALDYVTGFVGRVR